jgi:hypothetical protein
MNQNERPGLAFLVAVAIVAGSTLAYQVVLTRLFSAVVSYHFSFLAISLALVGTGAGALFVFLGGERLGGRSTGHLLARWSACFVGLLVACPFVLVRLDYDQGSRLFSANLAAACAVASLPPFASGVVIALAISRTTSWIGRVYAFDLLGAGLGALLVVPTLGLSPAPDLLVALGGVVGVACVLFAAGRGRLAAAGLTLAAWGIVAVSAFSSVLYLPTRYLVGTDVRAVYERWTPLARVFGFDAQGSGGLEGFTAVVYDRVYAPVPIVGDGPAPGWERLKTGPQSIGYELTGPGRALIIGGGGGRDIYTALASGQRPVEVIELNEGIRAVVDEDLGHLSGAPYSRPGVNTTIGDGRSVLAARDTRYDQIHIGFTDTLSANAAQGFALTESNLYTLEAFEEYFAHLRPSGVLNVSRPVKLVGEEALRMTVLVLAALEREGVDDPSRHVVVVLGRDILGPLNGTVLARLTPYTDSELERVRALARTRGEGVAFAAGGPYVGAWAKLARASSLESFCRSYPYDVCPPTDDRPFFFSMQRLSQIGARSSGALYAADPFSVLALTLAILLVLSALALGAPLALVRGGRLEPSTVVYFGAIGLGFLLVEIVLIQRFVLFLGFPTYALSVVLFSLLVSTGIGSALSARASDPRRALVAALCAAVVLIAASSWGLQPLLRRLIDLPFAARVSAAVLLLTPFGLTLGMAMPIGLRRLRILQPAAVPYAWGMNGIASVLASVLGIAVAIRFGFPAASLLACACYLVALLHALVGRWPAEA